MAAAELRFARVILFMQDVEESVAFYAEHFGFRPIPATRIPGEWAEATMGGLAVGFHQRAKMSSSSGAAMAKIVLHSDDIEGWHRKLKQAGLKVGAVISSGGLRFFDVKDPDGHIVQISNRPIASCGIGRSSGRSRTDTLP